MAKPWRLTRHAEAALADIALWTVETFGVRQAVAYEDDLIACCRRIASGSAQTYDCRRLIDPELPERLRFARIGQHFIVFVEDDTRIVILDFLHARTDLPQRLADLAGPGSDEAS